VELPSELVERLNEWSVSPVAASTTRIENRFVHKQEAANVFVARVAPLGPSRPDDHVAELALDPSHPYHFEHAQDHVPGMMLIEAGRQLAMAIAHIYYDVSLDSVFVLEQMSSSFTRFADLGPRVYMHASVSDKEYRRNRLTGMSSTGRYIQNGEVLGELSGRWTMLDRQLLERMLRRRPRTEAARAVETPERRAVVAE
jgi:hypothetical protein